MTPKLTVRQAAFVREYLIDLNATQAAIRAGYSKNGANVTACQLLANPNLQGALTKALAKREAKTEITADRVLQELALIAFSDITDYADISITPSKEIPGAYERSIVIRNTSNMDKNKVRAISTVEETQSGIKIKLNDKVKALELVAKHLGMFTEKLELTGKDGAAIEMNYDLSRLPKKELDELERIANKAARDQE